MRDGAPIRCDPCLLTWRAVADRMHDVAFNQLNQYQVYGLKAKIAVMETSLEKVEKGTCKPVKRRKRARPRVC